VSKNQPDSDADAATARPLAEALDPSAIDALRADAKAAGTPIDGVDGLLNQMTKAVLERALHAEFPTIVLRDRNGEFEPQIVPKRRRRVGQIDELILSR
jgi:putative transposase